jgi:hypothetical protein
LELRPGLPEKFVAGAAERPWHVVLDGDANFDGDTSYIAIVDKDRNMVSFEPSLHSIFGTGVVMGSRLVPFEEICACSLVGKSRRSSQRYLPPPSG